MDNNKNFIEAANHDGVKKIIVVTKDGNFEYTQDYLLSVDKVLVGKVDLESMENAAYTLLETIRESDDIFQFLRDYIDYLKLMGEIDGQNNIHLN